MVFIPLSFVILRAARVSAVSPDWEMKTTASLGSNMAFLYLYSLAYSTIQAIPASSSTMDFTASPTWKEEPQAMILRAEMDERISFVRPVEEKSILPSLI